MFIYFIAVFCNVYNCCNLLLYVFPHTSLSRDTSSIIPRN